MKPNKKCTHCGSSNTLPLKFGLISDEIHQENNKSRKWAWGGCVIYRDGNKDYCTNCNQSFGGIIVPQESTDSKESNLELFVKNYNKYLDEEKNEDLFIKNREKLLNKIDRYLDEERNEELYARALIEAEGDEIEAEHIYYGLFMRSISNDEA